MPRINDESVGLAMLTIMNLEGAVDSPRAQVDAEENLVPGWEVFASDRPDVVTVRYMADLPSSAEVAAAALPVLEKCMAALKETGRTVQWDITQKGVPFLDVRET